MKMMATEDKDLFANNNPKDNIDFTRYPFLRTSNL